MDFLTSFFKNLLKQPYWVIALIGGVFLTTFPCVSVSGGKNWSPHAPATWAPMIAGILVILLSATAFFVVVWRQNGADVGKGLDLSRVKEKNGGFSTTVNDCEISVVLGRIENYRDNEEIAVVLACNEYFDDRCVDDRKSALGAYVRTAFEGKNDDFISVMKSECKRSFGTGVQQQKAENEWGESFGPGKCILLNNPLGSSTTLALVSTTTQRAGQGLVARISYLLDGMRNLVMRLADARISDVAMPVLGAGHGRIEPPLAFVALLLAVAEAARYGQGGQRLRTVTIVVFKRDSDSTPEVDPVVIRRALALIGSST